MTFTVAKMSFGRRDGTDAAGAGTGAAVEFLEASEDAGDKMDAALLQAEIDRTVCDVGR